MLASKNIGDGKRCSSLVFLILFTFKMNRFFSLLTMESIFNDNSSMLVVNMFFHGGNHMYKIADVDALLVESILLALPRLRPW